MIPPPSVQKAINTQIKNELQAHYNYLGMSAKLEKTAYLGFAKWMRTQSGEEYTHAMKLVDYMRERNATIEFKAIDEPQCDHGLRPIEMFKAALQQEQGTTEQIHRIYELALKEKDYATLQFLTWFLQEQVEEENTVQDMVDRLKLAGDNAAALLRLDDEAARSALAPKAG
jgi:ferritin